jgi:hypothetical protein
MDNIIKEPQVMDVLIFEVLKKDLSKKTKMREAYRQHFCEVLPDSNPMAIISPKAKRQYREIIDGLVLRERSFQATAFQQTVFANAAATIQRSAKYGRC